MAEKHTEGPLTARRTMRGLSRDGGEMLVDDARVETDARQVVVELSGGNALADARRLGACWNACEGISTEALENNFVAYALAALALVKGHASTGAMSTEVGARHKCELCEGLAEDILARLEANDD